MVSCEEFLAACSVEMLKCLIYYVLNEVKEASSVQAELKKLNITLSIIQQSVEDVEKQQMEKAALKEWLERLKDVTYDADDILDKFSHHVMHEKEMSGRKRDKVRVGLSVRSNPVLFRFKMAKKIKDINERLDVIAKDKVWFDLPYGRNTSPSVSLYKQSRDFQETTSFISFVDNSRIIGREKDKENIIKILLETIKSSSSSSSSSSTSSRNEADAGVSVVSIVGMGGLGKTTLARLIYNDEEVTNTFELLIWVHVSVDFNVKKILRHIIESATQKTFDRDANMDILERIMKEILSEKRYLLVLDDLWSLKSKVWDKLKSQLNVGGHGSRIIVTTRSNEVADVVRGSEGSTYALKGLSAHECWSLLRQIAFAPGGAEETQNLVAIGKDIVSKCGGVPLAARSLGGLLYSMKSSEDWSFIRDSKSWGVAEDNHVLSVLRLSYRYLPSPLKQCFAYCSLFLEDSSFEKQTLIQLWMAEGFLHPSAANREKQIEEIGNDYFNSLLQNSLLHEVTEDQNGDTQHYKLHHLMHDLAKDVSGNQECSIMKVSEIVNEDILKVRRLRLIFDEGSRVTYPEPLQDELKLRTLFIHTRGEDKYINYENIFNYKKFRVLDLQWCTSIKELPSSIVKMKHLRYLDLSYTQIEELPEFISRLYNLQTLLLRYCPRLKSFPDKMESLKRLRYLDLSGSHFVVLPGSITHLSNLQTLNLKDCVKLKELPKHIKKLIHLRHLILSNNGSWSEMPREIGCLTRLQTLQVFKVDGRGGSSIRELGSLNLLERKLQISNLQHVTKPKDAKKANLKGKENIQSLVLEWSCRSDDAECAIDGVVMEQLLPNSSLKILKIVNYLSPRFPTWMTSSSISSSLPNLVELELQGCFICKELPGLGQLPSLKVLTIATMNDVVCLGNDFYGDDKACQPFPELVKLTLCNLRGLKKWCIAPSVSSYYPRLEKLIVERCPKLEHTQDVNFVKSFFPSIKEYELDGGKLITRLDLRRSIHIVRSMMTLKNSKREQRSLMAEQQ